jgi:hypothetical protein
MKKLLLLLVFITAFSCKEETKDIIVKEEADTKELKEKELEFSDGKYRIVFEGVFEEDDLMLIYYTTELEEELSAEKTLRKKIKASSSMQKIVFVLEEGQKPYNLRIDFSDNKNQKQVKLKTLLFLDKYNKIIINSKNIENYFSFNNYMTHNIEDSLLIGKIYNNGYNPYFVANQSLLSILKLANEASMNKLTINLIDDIYNTNFDDGNQRLIIKGTFEKDDLVLVFYTEDSLESFDIKNSIRKSVKGSDAIQEIILTIPNNIMASKLKLDISDKKQQTAINIESLIIKIDDSEIVMNKANLHEYFYANNYIDYNKIDGTFKCKVLIENNIERYNPYFISSPKLIEDLKYL